MSIPAKPHTEGQKFTNPETNIEYTYDGVKWIASGGEESSIDLTNCVKKHGGDDMQGPLHIKTVGVDARGTNRVTTLGVFSNSDSSALRLGTTRDRVYIGNNDTSINGPLKVDEIQEKNKDAGTTFVDDVKYKGATTNNTNIQTRESVVSLMDGYATKTELQQAINDLRDEIEQQRFNNILHDAPFVSKTNNTELYYSSNSGALPPNERLFGLHYDGNSMATNRFPANWNSHLRVGNGVVAIDRNGSKVDIPLGYDENWTGTVSIYEFNPSVIEEHTKLSLIFKNSVHNIRRSSGNNCVYITFGTEKDGYERHTPIFARGDVSGDLDGKKVIMLLDVYRIGDRHDPEGGGVSFDAVDESAITEPVVPEEE